MQDKVAPLVPPGSWDEGVPQRSCPFWQAMCPMPDPLPAITACQDQARLRLVCCRVQDCAVAVQCCCLELLPGW